MGTREDKKREIEQRIYDVALDLFCENGYAKTSLVDIASHAQVSTRTLYRYFPTKESIVRKFARENLMAMKNYANFLDPSRPLRDKVLDLMTYDYEQMFCLFDVSFVLNSMVDNSSDLTRFVLENFKITERIYCGVFQKEQLNAGITPNAGAYQAAILVMAIYRHVTDRMRLASTSIIKSKQARDYYENYLGMVWDSIEKLAIGEKDIEDPVALFK